MSFFIVHPYILIYFSFSSLFLAIHDSRLPFKLLACMKVTRCWLKNQYKISIINRKYDMPVRCNGEKQNLTRSCMMHLNSLRMFPFSPSFLLSFLLQFPFISLPLFFYPSFFNSHAISVHFRAATTPSFLLFSLSLPFYPSFFNSHAISVHFLQGSSDSFLLSISHAISIYFLSPSFLGAPFPFVFFFLSFRFYFLDMYNS